MVRSEGKCLASDLTHRVDLSSRAVRPLSLVVTCGNPDLDLRQELRRIRW